MKYVSKIYLSMKRHTKFVILGKYNSGVRKIFYSNRWRLRFHYVSISFLSSSGTRTCKILAQIILSAAIVLNKNIGNRPKISRGDRISKLCSTAISKQTVLLNMSRSILYGTGHVEMHIIRYWLDLTKNPWLRDEFWAEDRQNENCQWLAMPLKYYNLLTENSAVFEIWGNDQSETVRNLRRAF